MILLALSITAVACAALPCALFFRNLRDYRSLPAPAGGRPAVSVLIPARDEAGNIEAAVRSVLTARGVDLEVIVLDDHSSDGTPGLVRRMAEGDPRVRLVAGDALPDSWRGKNFACAQLARAARHPLLVFMDADVRMIDDDALSGLARFMDESGAGLASGVPRQITQTWLEQLIVPLIHFVLLSFLPLRRMRATTDPRFAAACGQLLAVRRETYERSGGHGAVAGAVHDAVALARNLRRHGFHSDVFDATNSFSCRMYRQAREVWLGFAKNAHEGLGAPRLIVPATVVLFAGQVAPFLLAVAMSPTRVAGLLAWLGVLCVLAPRLVAARRFRQPLAAALLHPASIVLLLAIQWHGALRHRSGRPFAWRGRALAAMPSGNGAAHA